MIKNISKSKEWHFISVQYAEKNTKGLIKDQKRHMTNIIDSTSHDELSKAKKSILGPETTKLSTRIQKCRRLSRMCLE